jgi:uridine phosphorylase
MNLSKFLMNRIYKWVTIYPWFRKIMIGMYNLSKMPQYHIDLAPGQIGAYVLLVENPDDVPRIAAHLDQAKEVASHREYLSYTGMYKDTPVTVISTGIGGPSAAIAIEELAVIGAETFIFLGLCETGVEDYIIAIGAVRDEGTGLHYTPLAFPALADFRVSASLQQACHDRRVKYAVGVVHSRDAFYRVGYTSGDSQDAGQSRAFPGVLAYDVNTAATLIVSSVLSKKAGAFLAKANGDGKIEAAQIEIALDALYTLIESDKNQ